MQNQNRFPILSLLSGWRHASLNNIYHVEWQGVASGFVLGFIFVC